MAQTIPDIEDGEPWTNEQFVPLIDQMRAETPTGALVIISDSLGQYLYTNHPAFIPTVSEGF